MFFKNLQSSFIPLSTKPQLGTFCGTRMTSLKLDEESQNQTSIASRLSSFCRRIRIAVMWI